MGCLRILKLSFSLYLFCGCASLEQEVDRNQLSTNREYDQVLKVEKIEDAQSESSEGLRKSSPELGDKAVDQPPKKELKKKTERVSTKKTSEHTTSEESAKIEKTNLKPSQDENKSVSDLGPQPRQPELEDDEGFDGRRPMIQPYEVGEEVVLGISYFGVEAGKFTMKVEPMIKINGKKAYHFKYLIQTSPIFNIVYRVNDVAETFVDYETLLPVSYQLHVDESKQARETRTYFDHKNLKATMWDRKKKKGEPLEKKKIEWDLEEYSQNVFSAAYYLRNFTLSVGKKLQVHVGHEGKNILMTAEVLREEKIFTPVGSFDTVVVKPSFDIDGKFKPTGENYLWLTKDDKKLIVRMESKIKIGSLVGEVKKIKKK